MVFIGNKTRFCQLFQHPFDIVAEIGKNCPRHRLHEIGKAIALCNHQPHQANGLFAIRDSVRISRHGHQRIIQSVARFHPWRLQRGFCIACKDNVAEDSLFIAEVLIQSARGNACTACNINQRCGRISAFDK